MDLMKSRWIADLDLVDITEDRDRTRRLLASNIDEQQREARRIDAELKEIAPELGRALAPPPINHPAADDQDDHFWFTKALSETGYAAKSEELDKTRAAVHSLVERLRSLSEFDDPRVEVSRGVMIAGWDYVQHLGLATSRQRLGSSPVSLAGLSLAEVVWQSRNQSEHVRSPKRQVVDAFEAIMNAHPTSFGFSRAAIPRPLVEATLKKQAWAREVLVLLGWTSRSAAVSGLLSIR